MILNSISVFSTAWWLSLTTTSAVRLKPLAPSWLRPCCRNAVWRFWGKLSSVEYMCGQRAIVVVLLYDFRFCACTMHTMLGVFQNGPSWFTCVFTSVVSIEDMICLSPHTHTYIYIYKNVNTYLGMSAHSMYITARVP